MPSLLPAPQRLVEDGRFNHGVFGTPFGSLNFSDAQVERGAGGGGLLRRRRLVEFQHFAIGNERFHVSVALFDSKGVGQAQVSIFDRVAKKKYRHERKVLSRELTLAETASRGESSFERGRFRIKFENGAAMDGHRLSFFCPAQRALPEVEGAFDCMESPDSSPCVVCIPFPGNAAMYSHKGIIPAQGSLCIGNEAHEFAHGASYAMTDFHKGYYPNPLKWNWAAGAGFDDAGRLYGFNLTSNQALEPERYNENWVFIGEAATGTAGRMERLPLVEFEIRDSDAIGQPWRMRDKDGRVDVTFHPEVSHSIDLNLLIMATRYRGPYGRFEGYVTTEAGEQVDVGRCFGMAEDFYLRG